VNTSQKKQPLLFIGLIIFLAVAVVGILYDFIAKAGGMVAIISVAAAFLILGIILIVDALSRRKEKAQANEFDDLNANEDRQFIRHAGEKKEEPFSWNPAEGQNPAFAEFRRREEERKSDVMDDFEESAFENASADDFESGFGDDFEDGIENVEESFEMNDKAENAAPEEEYAEELHLIQGRRRRPVRFFEDEEKSIEAAYADMTDSESIAETAEPQQEIEESQPVAEEQDDPFKPVLRLEGNLNTVQPQEEDSAEETVSEGIQEEVPNEPETQHEPEEKVKPEPEKKPEAAPERKAAAYAAPAVAAASAGGQTIESFYEEMSDEDILYRDCVEVWAADAKPAALRLIKYVEGIEDKQTAALIGREVEYVNAMIDRINCFTQLEYIDELLEYKEHNYSTLVKDCLKRFSPFFMEKRLGLLWKGLDINVLTDRRWFIFALTQVIFNAVEFTPNGGKIAISAKKHEEYIDLTVEDSGKGIAPEELPFIFMAGYMGDDAPNESGRRTGMGLFIAQSVMRKMGGDMLAESVQGKGTRITLRMPIIDPMA